MVAFLFALLVTVAMTGVVVAYARRRPEGTPLTWGEAFAGAGFVFALMVMAYGYLPHQWLQWADKELGWRKDKMGVPLGPIGTLFGDGKWLGFLRVRKNTMFPSGITFFGRGRVALTAETMRDLVATVIYLVGLGTQFYLWTWWQKRGVRAREETQRRALATSAYGRPLARPEA